MFKKLCTIRTALSFFLRNISKILADITKSLYLSSPWFQSIFLNKLPFIIEAPKRVKDAQQFFKSLTESVYSV